ncbi:hypothetical protein TUM3792_25370 [Shewanella sp. MBTL60-007]|nr:hypothetical protein TUM3792_25370 [Shewanella sp. MBTL60-007]
MAIAKITKNNGTAHREKNEAIKEIDVKCDKNRHTINIASDSGLFFDLLPVLLGCNLR